MIFDLRFTILKKLALFILFLLSSVLSPLSSVFADDLTALTDTNGIFTWPPTIAAWQIGDYTNKDLRIVNTNNGAMVDLSPNGYFSFTDASGMMIQSAPTAWTILQTNGNGFYYSNGIVGTIGDTMFDIRAIQSIVANWPTNLGAQPNYLTNMQNAILALSNQVFASFTASNSIILNALTASNAAMLTALQATNFTLQTNYLALLGNATNFANLIGFNLTNYAYFLATNNGAQITNFAFSIGAGATNYANLIGIAGTNYGNFVSTNGGSATNYIAQHFRFGQYTFPANTNWQLVSFSPSFNDPNFIVYLSPAAGGYTNVLSGLAMTYNQFSIQIPAPSVGAVFNYLLYHP